MVAFGLVLVAVGALLVVAAVFTAEVTADGKLELLGTGVGALVLFLIGLFAGLAMIGGAVISRTGVKRALAQRAETKRLTKLSEQLDKVEAERRKDADDDRND